MSTSKNKAVIAANWEPQNTNSIDSQEWLTETVDELLKDHKDAQKAVDCGVYNTMGDEDMKEDSNKRSRENETDGVKDDSMLNFAGFARFMGRKNKGRQQQEGEEINYDDL